MNFRPHDYQRQAAQFWLDRDCAGWFLDPGLGKTATGLTVINGLKRAGAATRTLIVAPLRVVYSVWPAETQAWTQFKNLSTSIVHGTPAQRKAALDRDADIHLINPEGIQWLSETPFADFDTLIIDESTKFKSPKRKTPKGNPSRWACLQKMLPRFSRRAILTGTPCPNTYIDLWSQIYILDQGERLGKTITEYRRRFFYRGGYENREYFLQHGAKERIESLISDIVLRLDCRDLLDMPDLVFNDIFVELPTSVRTAYNKLERELFFALDEKQIDETAFSASAKYLMCRQIANGGLYVGEGDNRKGAHAHDAKIDAIADLHEELHGKPLMVVFHFKHELERLQKRFGGKVPVIAGGVSASATDDTVRRWNEGRLPLLFVQPQAMSHGLNMQRGGHDMAWLGLADDLEVYRQTIARLWRQGQQGGVRIHRVFADRTVDLAIRDRLDDKSQAQQSLLRAIQRYQQSR